MNIETLTSTISGDIAIWTEMQVPSLLIFLRHEFIYTWQLVPLEFNLSTPISQMAFLPTINSFVQKQNMHFVELSNYLQAVASRIEKLVAFHSFISLWVELDWQRK